ncbi:GNAT superfamily N-acetyltransferase [Deinobacterium chartae]|uniref:GNAT superfamily N-acetyltransferase n=1 Tax=Deinobacterium chartae TaxID=521158 RepID=A0A841HUB0_9DEIO|nr:GNAT family N-acetyltransferase [Deinobacterium chartae]MBB6096937.1 GNAT superfamily N-acetyltransferase [Deinobacterium chartae]
MTVQPRFHRAELEDLPLLLELLPEYYAIDRLPYQADVAEAALTELIRGEGEAYLILAGGELAGHMLLTRLFSVEYGGHGWLLDELYLRQEFRGQGLGGAALAFLEARARETGARYIELQVTPHNEAAARLYLRHGFQDFGRRVLSRTVTQPH